MRVVRIKDYKERQIEMPLYLIEFFFNDLSGSAIKLYLFLLCAAAKGEHVEQENLFLRAEMDPDTLKQAWAELKAAKLIADVKGNIILSDVLPLYEAKVEARRKKHQYVNGLTDLQIKQLEELTTELQKRYFNGQMSNHWSTWIQDQLMIRYQFKPEVILTLFQDVYTRGNLTRNYVQSIAEEWHRNGVQTISDLNAYLLLKEKSTEIVNMAASAVGHKPISLDYEFADQWVSHYKYDKEIIQYALKRLANVQVPTMRFLHNILTGWHKADLKTLDDIKAYEESQRKSRSKKRSVKSQNTHNYHERSDHVENFDADLMPVFDELFNQEETKTSVDQFPETALNESGE